MKWWCGACGCELPTNKDGMIDIVPCHCGAVMGGNYQPKDPVKTDKCPHEPDGPERTGAFKAAVN